MTEIVTDFTPTEVLDALNASGALEDGWDELTWHLKYNNDGKTTITLRGAEYAVEKVAEDDGGDYSYDTFVIIKVGSQMFRKTGHYQSHYGNEWDGDFRAVRPVTKSVTVYE